MKLHGKFGSAFMHQVPRKKLPLSETAWTTGVLRHRTTYIHMWPASETVHEWGLAEYWLNMKFATTTSFDPPFSSKH